MKKIAKAIGFAATAGVISSVGIVAANANTPAPSEPSVSTTPDAITFVSPDGNQTTVEGLSSGDARNDSVQLDSSIVSPSNLEVPLTPETPNDALTPLSAVSPVSAASPLSPVSPVSPASPLSPVSPVGTVSPVSPLSPVTP